MFLNFREWVIKEANELSPDWIDVKFKIKQNGVEVITIEKENLEII